MRLLVLLVALCFATAAAAAEVHIGYLSLDNDPRYMLRRSDARLDPAPHSNALAGARIGLEDTGMQAKANGIDLTLDARSGKDGATLLDTARQMAAAGDAFILLDLPGDLVADVAAGLQQGATTLVNVSAPEDSLRCLPGLLHTAPADRMLADALAQLLVTRNWHRVLILAGETTRDRQLAQSFTDAARRYRLDIADTRTFTLASDPQQRDLHNPLLLTGGLDYDVIYVADSTGEFGPYLPYATELPRPIIGTSGLVPQAWHWSFDRYGAPQVNARFIREAKRRMAGADWSAWMAVKAVAAAYLKSNGDTAAAKAFLTSEDLTLDGSKGIGMNFRSWDGQMRMPILLATDSAVIAMAPFEGFKHQSNDLDTLGRDAPEPACN